MENIWLKKWLQYTDIIVKCKKPILLFNTFNSYIKLFLFNRNIYFLNEKNVNTLFSKHQPRGFIYLIHLNLEFPRNLSSFFSAWLSFKILEINLNTDWGCFLCYPTFIVNLIWVYLEVEP